MVAYGSPSIIRTRLRAANATFFLGSPICGPMDILAIRHRLAPTCCLAIPQRALRRRKGGLMDSDQEALAGLCHGQPMRRRPPPNGRPTQAMHKRHSGRK